MSLTTDKSKSSFQSAIPQSKVVLLKGVYLYTSTCWLCFRLFDISVLHSSRVMMNVCLSVAHRPKPASLCQDGCVRSAQQQSLTPSCFISINYLILGDRTFPPSTRSDGCKRHPERANWITLDSTTKIPNNAALELSRCISQPCQDFWACTFPCEKAKLDSDKLSAAHSVYTQQALAVYGKSKQ